MSSFVADRKGNLIAVRDDVMKELELRQGQTVSDAQVWDIIGENASRGLAEIAIDRAKNK